MKRTERKFAGVRKESETRKLFGNFWRKGKCINESEKVKKRTNERNEEMKS